MIKKITKITIRRDIAVVSSRVLAEQLGKRQDNIIRDIENIIQEYNSNLRATNKKNKTDILIKFNPVLVD